MNDGYGGYGGGGMGGYMNRSPSIALDNPHIPSSLKIRNLLFFYNYS